MQTRSWFATCAFLALAMLASFGCEQYNDRNKQTTPAMEEPVPTLPPSEALTIELNEAECAAQTMEDGKDAEIFGRPTGSDKAKYYGRMLRDNVLCDNGNGLSYNWTKGEYAVLQAALVVRMTNVNPLTNTRGPCVPLTLVKCGDENTFTPTGAPYTDRWICALVTVDEFGWNRSSAESMPCPQNTECLEVGTFPNIGLCQAILECETDADCPDDGDQCTAVACVNNMCETTERFGLACNDGAACTVNDICWLANGGNVHLTCVGTPVDCDDANDCTGDSCNPATGACINTNLPNAPATLCDDTDRCTEADVCLDGVCVGTPVDCDDANDCTADNCDAATGQCLNVALPNNPPVACDDSLLCTTGDVCLNGACAGTAVNCDDENPCTRDACDPLTGQCDSSEFEPDGTPCDTAGGVCVVGECIPGGWWCLEGEADHCRTVVDGPGQTLEASYTCDVRGEDGYGEWILLQACGFQEQGFYCTTDAQERPVCSYQQCQTDANCAAPTPYCLTATHVCVACLTDAQCADQDPLTADTCVVNRCVHTPTVECTADAQCLDPLLPRCNLAANECVACLADADCTPGLCRDFVCVPACTQASDCVDGDVCTADACANGACTHTAVPGCCNTSAQCDDGDPCTTDACAANACTHTAIAGCCTADANCAAPTPYCATSHTCAACTADAHCPAGQVCDATGHCVLPVVPDRLTVKWVLPADGAGIPAGTVKLLFALECINSSGLTVVSWIDLPGDPGAVVFNYDPATTTSIERSFVAPGVVQCKGNVRYFSAVNAPLGWAVRDASLTTDGTMSYNYNGIAVSMLGVRSNTQGGGNFVWWPNVDTDGDNVCDNVTTVSGICAIPGPDNCRTTANPAQTDTDGDGLGDACDP